MKIKAEHLAVLEESISEILAKYNQNGKLIEEYETGQFSNADKVKDLQRRFCFDLLYGAGLNKFVCDELYTYMDDTHIYTALKKVCPEVHRRY